MLSQKKLFLFVGCFDEGPEDAICIRAESRESAAGWIMREAKRNENIRATLSSMRALQTQSVVGVGDIPNEEAAAALRAPSKKSKKKTRMEMSESDYLDVVLQSLSAGAFLALLDESYVDGDSSARVQLMELNDPIEV